jgi:hypothetical protein
MTFGRAENWVLFKDSPSVLPHPATIQNEGNVY